MASSRQMARPMPRRPPVTMASPRLVPLATCRPRAVCHRALRGSTSITSLPAQRFGATSFVTRSDDGLRREQALDLVIGVAELRQDLARVLADLQSQDAQLPAPRRHSGSDG